MTPQALEAVTKVIVMKFPAKRTSILQSIKPQLKQRYALEAKAAESYKVALMAEHQLSGWEAGTIARAVMDRVVANFKRDLAPGAASVFLSDKEVLESMLFDAAIVAEQMDEAGELDEILAQAQTEEDREKHDF